MNDSPDPRWSPRKLTPNAARLARLAVAGILVLYAVILVASNTEEVNLDFVFFSTDAPLVVALVLVGVLGFLIGAALLTRQSHRADDSDHVADDK